MRGRIYMESQIIVAIISAAAVVVVAFIEGISLRIRKQDEKRAEQRAEESRLSAQRAEARAERRAEESRLSMQMADANGMLTKIIAKKLLNHELNGDVEEAMNAMASAQAEYNSFLQETASKAVAKV